jgi:hypothetical protein
MFTMEHIMEIVVRNNFCRKFSLRVHKFSFQWDLVVHLSVCILSLCPFFFTGNRIYSMLPLSVWAFYHVLFLLGPKQANLVIPGFGKFKQSFKTILEEFFPPKLLPVLSISFLLVALSLGVTGHRLGGPPLCYHPCGICLAQWSNSITLDAANAESIDPYRHGCGYANGKELLSYYTMAQTSFLLFFTVVVAMAVCLGWRIADEERDERAQAEAWLKRESPSAFELRNELITKFGPPASSIRPEGGPAWVFFGVTAAVTFTLLGWHNWYVLSPSPSATLLIILNLLTIIMTTLILHLGFFGRLLALYRRNYQRVACLTAFLRTASEAELESWWDCRTFVLNDDLSLDYDIGGLAVSATFLIDVFVFITLLAQVFREGGYNAMLEPPGSYCAYALMYVSTCMIKIFTLATNTYEEQHRHISELQNISAKLLPKVDHRDRLALAFREDVLVTQSVPSIFTQSVNNHQNIFNSSFWADDFHLQHDDGPIFIDPEAGDAPAIGGGAAAEGEQSDTRPSRQLVPGIQSSGSPPDAGQEAEVLRTPAFFASSPAVDLSAARASGDEETGTSKRGAKRLEEGPGSTVSRPCSPSLSRQASYSHENYRQSIAEIISQIR